MIPETNTIISKNDEPQKEKKVRVRKPPEVMPPSGTVLYDYSFWSKKK